MDERIIHTEGNLNGHGLRFGIVASRFNDFIVDRLISGAVDALMKHGANTADIEIIRVPGAFEISLALQKLAESKRHDALIALGCVIRGDTPHFEHVAAQAANGVNQVMLTHGLPIGFGILAVDTIEQAIERAGAKAGNKGVDAALATIEMASLFRKLER